jgi:hypothetical protein
VRKKESTRKEGGEKDERGRSVEEAKERQRNVEGRKR